VAIDNHWDAEKSHPLPLLSALSHFASKAKVPTRLLAETGGEPLPLMRSARELIAEAEDEVRVGFELRDCLIKG